MKSFELYEPTSVQQAVGLLNQFGATGKALGGGSDLIGGIMKDWVQGKGQPLPVPRRSDHDSRAQGHQASL